MSRTFAVITLASLATLVSCTSDSAGSAKGDCAACCQMAIVPPIDPGPGAHGVACRCRPQTTMVAWLTALDRVPTLIETAARLCHAHMGGVFQLQPDGAFHWKAGYGLDPQYEEHERSTPHYPGEDTLVGRVALRMGAYQILDTRVPARAAINDAVSLARQKNPRLAGVVKMLAEELGPFGTRMNGILPVRIATERVREIDALSGDPDEVRARKSEDIPLRRYGEPEEFGRVAAFLLSPPASYITGAMIPVDGGSMRVI